MMIYSKTCEYAIRALLYLATKNGKSLAMIPEVNRETGVPGPYLAKIFQCLARCGILESKRGPCGGFSLRKLPERISLFEIIEAVDDLVPLVNECIMGLDRCSVANACPLHFVWAKTRKQILNRLQASTLKRLTKKIGRVHYRELKRSRLNEALQISGCK